MDNQNESQEAVENKAAAPTDEKQAAQKDQAEALKQCEQVAAEWKDKYLHVAADFQNYKKRLEKDRAHLSKVIKADLLLEILNIVDNFDRALEMKQQESMQEWMRGFEMIAKELYKFLEKQGVSEIETTSTFNPELHEAVMQVEADDHQPGDIVEVLQKGYLLNGDVLRPAKVSVAQ